MGEPFAFWGFWVLIITLVAHLLEFIVFYPLVMSKDPSKSALEHFIHTMVFGLFHWRPIKSKLAHLK